MSIFDHAMRRQGRYPAPLFGPELEYPYVTCPRCRGRCQVYVTTRPSNGFSRSIGECFTCNVCNGTGTIHRDQAEQILEDEREDDD